MRLLPAILASTALLLVPASAWAGANPRLAVHDNGVDDGAKPDSDEQARVLDLAANVHVVGNSAEVTLDMLVASAGAGPQEVRLALTMPEGAVVTGYALNVGEAMIEGQLLERPRARYVYENEVRRGIDPGLAEVDAGNVFSTRIFPVSAHAPRRVQITFAAPYDPATGLVLPLELAERVPAVRLTFRAEGLASAPSVTIGGRAIDMSGGNGSWSGTAQMRDLRLASGIAVSDGSALASPVLTRHSSGERFVMLAGEAGAPGPVPQGRLRVYWDRSLSHGDADLAAERAVLAQLVRLMGGGPVDLVTFASDAPQVTSHDGVASLDAALDGVSYLGATSFAGLDALDLPEAALCVLVSDGQVSLDHAASFAPGCRMSALSAAADPDAARLSRLSRGGGQFVHLGIGTDTAEAARRLASGSAGPVSLRDAAGQAVPFRVLRQTGGGWLLVAPTGGSDSLRLRVTDAQGRTSERTIDTTGTPVAADAPGALWAEDRVSELADDPAAYQQMVAFARRFHVAGPDLSLLVLERADQYVTADLAPPQGFPKAWMDDYDRQRAAADAQEAREQQARFGFVLNEWERRTQWWNEKFDAAPARPNPGPRPQPRDGAPMPPPPPVAIPTMAPPPPPPPPPPPGSPAPQRDYEEAGNDIVVTGTRIEGATADFAMASPITSVGGEVLEQAADADSRAPIVAGRPGGRDIGMTLEDMLDERPYLAALDAAPERRRLAVLAEQQRRFGQLPVFYLDTAEWFRLHGDTATASLLLLSVLELPATDDSALRLVAFRLERDHDYDRAVALAERVAARADHIPQPRRALALALAARGLANGRAGRADLERAFALLTEVALEPTEGAYDGIEVIALMEANALIPAIEAAGGTWSLDERLVGLLDTDVRVVIEWTSADADIDLWVDEPNGERVYYGDKLSSSGGQISNDMTDGYGPEEYAIHSAPRGTYEVRVNGYDADRLNPNGGGRVLVRVIRNFGRQTAEQEMVDTSLNFQDGWNRNDEGGVRPVATLEIGR